MRKGLREITVVGDLAFIPLTRGYVATIDAADVSLVSGHNWSVYIGPMAYTQYARRHATLNGKSFTAQLHRVILDAPAGVLVDHINGDGLDNRRSNLRFATKTNNNCNSRLRRDNKCGLKGVSWSAQGGKWLARIRINRKGVHLGYFSSPEEAHAAYVRASAEMHGEFGRLS